MVKPAVVLRTRVWELRRLEGHGEVVRVYKPIQEPKEPFNAVTAVLEEVLQRFQRVLGTLSVVVRQARRKATQWSLAIMDIDLPELTDGYKPSFITVNTNICETSFINCPQAPILQRLYYNQLVTNKPHIFDHLRYIPITADTLESLSIYLVDSSGARPSFKDGHSSCTLHMEKSE